MSNVANQHFSAYNDTSSVPNYITKDPTCDIVKNTLNFPSLFVVGGDQDEEEVVQLRGVFIVRGRVPRLVAADPEHGTPLLAQNVKTLKAALNS